MSAKQRMKQAAQANVKDRVIEIPITKLQESPFNKYMPLDNIEELAASICDKWETANQDVYNLLVEKLF